MSSPQLENGYLRIANELIEALFKVNLSPYETRVLLFIIRQTYGFNKKMDCIALSQFSKKLGIDRRNVHRALKSLLSKMIVVSRDDKENISYGLQKDYHRWKVSSKPMTVISRDDKVSSVETPTKYNKDNIYTSSFLEFWKAYPKKKAKGSALKAWKKLSPSKELFKTIFQAVETQKTWPDWKKDGGQFIPYPATWLNQRRWEDEPEVKQRPYLYQTTAEELRRQRGE